ncbi:MAG: formate/nitrite transporter family protein, partial [Gemmatimonadetes bacterium]|nr:formate/nitrite transporter family protein [Gemmatimonadota bacterium]
MTADRSPSAPSSQEPSDEDLQESHSGSDQPSTYGEILAEQIWTAVHELERPTGGLILSGFSAGLDVGFSVFFMAIAFSMFGADFSDVGVRIFAANLYSFGFILVILGRSELFTEHTTLAVFPVLNRRA